MHVALTSSLRVFDTLPLEWQQRLAGRKSHAPRIVGGSHSVAMRLSQPDGSPGGYDVFHIHSQPFLLPGRLPESPSSLSAICIREIMMYNANEHVIVGYMELSKLFAKLYLHRYLHRPSTYERLFSCHYLPPFSISISRMK